MHTVCFTLFNSDRIDMLAFKKCSEENSYTVPLEHLI